MRRHKIEKISQIAKVGDTARDMEEGRYAGTPHVFGVLTGADNRETLLQTGAAVVLNSVADIRVASMHEDTGISAGMPEKKGKNSRAVNASDSTDTEEALNVVKKKRKRSSCDSHAAPMSKRRA